MKKRSITVRYNEGMIFDDLNLVIILRIANP